MSIRKMITFPERGAQLLAEATGNARERAAGEYISAVLAQRHRAWSRALDALLAAGYGRAELHELVSLFQRRGNDAEEIADTLGNTLAGRGPSAREQGRWFYDLALEYDAQNRALLQALERGST